MSHKAKDRPLRLKRLAMAVATAFIAPPAQALDPGDPLGPAIDLNSPLAGNNQTTPAIARNAAGDIVVAWHGPTANGSDILVQRVDASGAPQGSAFIANQRVDGEQVAASVAIDADGDFVVAWTDGSPASSGIRARRFDADGNALGAEFAVSDASERGVGAPAVAMDADGDFVVSWSQGAQAFFGPCSYGEVCSGLMGSAVRARRYTADGTADAKLITVDTTLAVSALGITVGSMDYRPTVAMHEDGGFVVGWTRYGNGLLSGIYARRYSPAGIAALPQPVALGFDEDHGVVATSGSGEFVLAYVHADDAQSIYVRPYRASGVAESAALPADESAYGASFPSVAMSAGGDFVVVWDGLGEAVGQRFARGGGKLGDNFTLSTGCCVRGPVVATDAAGNFAAAWSISGRIKLRLYAGQ